MMSRKTKTTATKEEARPALVPKLRFPEFRGADGWDRTPLGRLLLNSPDYGVNAAAVPFSEQLPKYLRITDISQDGRYRPEKQVSVDLDATDGNYLDEGDIVLARTGASVGKSYQYRKEDGRLVFAGFLIRVKPNPKKLNSTYLANFLTTEQYWRWVAATSARSGQPGINSTEYSSLVIPLPMVFAEQQKIAECLSSVDELMAAQARKVDALKTHKKGLMQQLFPREGETQPRLRFPEFQNAGEWEPRNVSQFAKVTTGAKDTQNKVEGGKYPFFVRSQTVERIDSFSYDGEAVLTSGDGVGVGKNFHHIVGKFDFHQRVYCIYDFDDDVSGLFFYLYFSEHFGERVMRMSAKNSVDSVRMAMITEMPVMLPTLPEQQRIASCLSSLDALITAETQQLETLKTHKKGLMQQLFPSPEEVEA